MFSRICFCYKNSILQIPNIFRAQGKNSNRGPSFRQSKDLEVKNQDIKSIIKVAFFDVSTLINKFLHHDYKARFKFRVLGFPKVLCPNVDIQTVLVPGSSLICPVSWIHLVPEGPGCESALPTIPANSHLLHLVLEVPQGRGWAGHGMELGMVLAGNLMISDTKYFIKKML